MAEEDIDPLALKSTDPEFGREVEAQIVVLKSAANEVQKQNAAQRLWTLAESGNKEEEMARQSYIIREGAVKPLVQMLREGNEETKWRAARALVQLAFSNEETSTRLAKTKAIKAAAEALRDLDGCTDRIKETALQLLNNIASNCWTCHEAIIATDILGHVLVILRSITIPDPVKRAAVNLVFSLSFTEEGKISMLEVDTTSCLVPIIRANKTSINSVCATLAVANLVGHRARAHMLQGCGVVEKVLKALEHSLNREPMGGHYHNLWKVVLAFQQLCKSDTHKETLVRDNGVALLARLMDLSPDRQTDRNLVYGCNAVWHLAFNGQAKALLCEEAVLCERMEEIALADDHVAMQEARGALFQLGIIPKPPFADAMTHIFLSFDEVMAHRAQAIKTHLEAKHYLVWTEPASGKMDENFRVGVSNCAAFCACLSANYHLSAKTRTEINFAVDSSKYIITLTVDDEGREHCWLESIIHGKQRVDFSSPENDEESTDELIQILGGRGKVVQRKPGAAESPYAAGRDHRPSPTEAPPLAGGHGSSAAGAASSPAQSSARRGGGDDRRPSPALDSRRPQSGSVAASGDVGGGKAEEADEGVALALASPVRSMRVAEHIPGGHHHNGRSIPGSTIAPEDEVQLWTVQQVVEWLDKTLVLGQYQEAFLDQYSPARLCSQRACRRRVGDIALAMIVFTYRIQARLRCLRHRRAFGRKVDGLKLASMDDEQLELELHVSSKLHRKKILTRVSRLMNM